MFKIRPDRAMDYGVSCPWVSEKKTHRLKMGEMMPSRFLGCFLIRSYSYLQVMKTCINVWLIIGNGLLWLNVPVKKIQSCWAGATASWLLQYPFFLGGGGVNVSLLKDTTRRR